MSHPRRGTSLLLRLAPPRGDASARLIRAAAGVTLRRLRRAAVRFRTPALARLEPRAATLLRAARDLIRELGPRDRLLVLHGPDLRGFLSEIEIWSGVLLDARSTNSKRLFDRISRTEHLVELLPHGRVDPGFPARAARLASRRLAWAFDDLAALLLGARLAFLGGRGRFEARLGIRESAEQGRPADRVDLGSFGGQAGPLSVTGGLPSGSMAGAGIRARLQDGLLSVRARSGQESLFPQAAAPVRFPWTLNGGSRSMAPAGGSKGPTLLRRRLIPGTPILLAPALRSSPRRLRVARDLPGLESRLATGLRLARLAWPDAYEEILRRTAIVVPVEEPGLVSYSLAARPGVSFINVRGKTIVQLADDLLHETAHHLLHDLQETADLLAPGPDTEEVQAFESPWRGTRRPLHGLLHGAYTFLFRAELFARLLRARSRHRAIAGRLLGPRRAAFLSRELGRELGMIGGALNDLERASRHGLVTPQGRVLVRSLRAWHTRLSRST
ncbi:MAG TPA: HEXXH motif-containing putative peptide modification protein [Candidatus Cryosericum sp.]|nr:HEXXH motif-containing putative peptide modification protein [Candidatus Cryosericum sp.]